MTRTNYQRFLHPLPQKWENGISLGEMNARLLQKIEELALYAIEQNKKIVYLNH